MRRVKLVFTLLAIVIFGALIFYFYNELKPKPPIKEEVITEEKGEEVEKEEQEPLVGENIKRPVLLFEKILLYPIIDYPFVYAYDPENKTIKEINLVDKTFKEFYKGGDIKNLSFSEDKNGILFKKDRNYYYLDILNDKLERLPLNIKTAFWYKNNLYGYILTESSSYLADLKKNLEKFVDLYILNPKFDVLNDGIIVYEDLRYVYSSPLILIKKDGTKKILLESAKNLSALTDKNELIFISLMEKGWKSYLIDKNSMKLKEFNFGTLKEKCTFKDILICGVPKNQTLSDPSNWYYYKENFSDRLVIFDPKNNNLKYYDLDKDYDILNPTLTPLGIIYLNRLDNRLYQVSLEDFSFQKNEE